MEKKFNSISEEGKALVMEYMATVEGEVERKDIIKYIQNNISNKETLTVGIEAGIIKMLSASGEIVAVSRGKYRRGVKIEGLSLRVRVLNLFDNFQKELDRACTVNLLKAADDDKEFIRKVGEISNQLEGAIWALEEMEEEPEVPAKVEENKEVIESEKKETDSKKGNTDKKETK